MFETFFNLNSLEAGHRKKIIVLTLLTPILTILIGLGVGSLIMAVMNAILSVNELAF